jgi:exosortase O
MWYLKNLVAGEATFSLLAGLMAAIFWLREPELSKDLRRLQAHGSWLALNLTIVALSLMVFNSYAHHLNMVRAFSSSLLTLGLAGFFVQPRLFLRSLPLSLFICILIPLERHVETFIGFPLRLLTAEITRSALSSVGVIIQGTSTILVAENAASSIDSACSGVKTIWAGTLFFLLASHISRQRLNFRWFLHLSLTIALLVTANFFRVLLLSVLALVVKNQDIFRLLHLPLGASGFVAVCLIASCLAKTKCKIQEDIVRKKGVVSAPTTIPIAISCLLTSALAAGAAPIPLPTEAKSPKSFEVQFSANLQIAPLPLTHQEKNFFYQRPGAKVSKWRFRSSENPSQSGTMVISISRSSLAQHDPLQCLVGSGHDINSRRTILVDQKFPVHMATIVGTDGLFLHWFQRRGEVTVDFSHRFWAGILHSEPWIMVSVLLDPSTTTTSTQTLELLQSIRADMALILSNEEEINHDRNDT